MTAQARRQGISVLTVTHANGTASTTEPALTVTTNSNVRPRMPATLGLNSRSHSSPPPPSALTARYTGGSKRAAPTISAGTSRASGGELLSTVRGSRFHPVRELVPQADRLQSRHGSARPDGTFPLDPSFTFSGLKNPCCVEHGSKAKERVVLVLSI